MMRRHTNPSEKLTKHHLEVSILLLIVFDRLRNDLHLFCFRLVSVILCLSSLLLTLVAAPESATAQSLGT